MARANPTQYLWKPKDRNAWSVKIKVPASLQKQLGKVHIVRNLGTGDLHEANELKHAVVADIKAELRAITPGRTLAKVPTYRPIQDPRDLKQALREAREAGDEAAIEAIESIAADEAESIEHLHGEDKAQKFYRAATITTPNLAELAVKWIGSSDAKASTKAGYEAHVAELLAFLNDPGAFPVDVTKAVALRYLEDFLEAPARGWAADTIKERLRSLSMFWRWMALREAVPDGFDPWKGHRVSKVQHQSSRAEVRAYTDDEIAKLKNGNLVVKAWPTFQVCNDLAILGMYTGARIEELCSMAVSQVTELGDARILQVLKGKNKAAARFIAIVHPDAIAVLKRRMEGKTGAERLFSDREKGGLDEKFSKTSSQAFTRYRRACGVPDGPDYHSYRRTVITKLERADVSERSIARFVGHTVKTMAGDVYSEGGSAEQAVETAMKITYG